MEGGKPSVFPGPGLGQNLTLGGSKIDPQSHEKASFPREARMGREMTILLASNIYIDLGGLGNCGKKIFGGGRKKGGAI